MVYNGVMQKKKEVEIKVVTGANYGDEGKGLAARSLALNANKNKKKPVIVLTNGGCQRGHTIDYKNGSRHVFHHFGSGHADGIATFISSYFLVNPQVFVKEYNELYEKFRTRSTIMLDVSCNFITPFDIALNQHFEECLGDKRFGSVGQGIWEAINREDKISVGEFALLNEKEKYNYLCNILNHWVPKRKAEFYESMNITNPPEDKLLEIVSSRDYLTHWISDFYIMTELCVCVTNAENLQKPEYSEFCTSYENAFKDFDVFVLENAQGLLLDEETGTCGEHCTPSRTGIVNVEFFVNRYYNFFKNLSVGVEPFYVSRTYITKHGAGNFPEYDSSMSEFEDKTNVPNPWQGTLRFGRLNVEELTKRIIDDIKRFEGYDFTTLQKANIIFTHCNEVQIQETHCQEIINSVYSFDKYSENIKL